MKLRSLAVVLFPSFLGVTYAIQASAVPMDINRCPEKMTIVLSGIVRTSESEFQDQLKQLYSYSTDQDTSGPVRNNWAQLSGVTQYSLDLKLNDRSDRVSPSYCLYLTGAGESAVLTGGERAEKYETFLAVSTRFGGMKSHVLSYDPGSVQVEQDADGLQIKNWAHAGYEDGGYIATIVIGAAGRVSVQ